jgi:hypothetical protein
VVGLRFPTAETSNLEKCLDAVGRSQCLEVINPSTAVSTDAVFMNTAPKSLATCLMVKTRPGLNWRHSVFHPNRLILVQRSHKGNIKRLKSMDGVCWKAHQDNVTFTCEFNQLQAFCLTYVSIQELNKRFPFC